MLKLKDFFKGHKKLSTLLSVVMLVLLYFIFLRGNGVPETYTVGRADVVESVELSGTVSTVEQADLGFAAAGRLQRISVQNNQMVAVGQTLAQLEVGELLADLKIKQANLAVSDIDLEAAKENLERVKAQEDIKVENAYRNLLSEGLSMLANSDSYTAAAPEINGVYNGPEGEYKIIFDKGSMVPQDWIIKTFNLENTKGAINDEGPTPLGTKGLYVSFPDDLESYVDTIWYLKIPNKSSEEYLENYNAYNDARAERDRAVEVAEFDYEKVVAESERSTRSSVAQAEVDKINAEIHKNTIHAPFAGRVTNIEKEVGESASVGERVISILGEEKLEVVLQVSELDAPRISPGLAVTISLDPFPRETFLGVLRTINSKETTIDGVPVYEAFVGLTESEKVKDRVKTGMSAKARIVLQEKPSVVAVPSYLVKKIGESNFVNILGSDGKEETREVYLGVVGTDNLVEVLAGLAEGEVLTPVEE